MNNIVFFDLEIASQGVTIRDIGAFREEDRASFHSSDVASFLSFVSRSDILCAHNLFAHDLVYIGPALEGSGRTYEYIDTLYLSELLFPSRPYHHLVKDDKLQTDELNNPLNDSLKARDLFFEEVSAYGNLPKELQEIFHALLSRQKEFSAFFRYVGGECPEGDVETAIRRFFHDSICAHAELDSWIKGAPLELAYALALINTHDQYSIIPPWASIRFPKIHVIINELCNIPCREGCEYCQEHHDIRKALKNHFGFDSFRTYNGEPLQERAAQAAVDGKSLLAIFPTGGGKSITFQLPALMAGVSAHGLTVVISPLQSLMKDQVDNLEKKGIIGAVTINGLLNPIERSAAIERVANGDASILYISPESLRSSSIQDLLLKRNVVRFVIDEAHCFSAWGQDFRVDYMYIGDFIRDLQQRKRLEQPIPVSCFTATAKKKVISDIVDYFRDKLGVELELFTTDATRENLRYEVLFQENEEEKYQTLRTLIQSRACPTIVYVSRTRKTWELADRLTSDGLPALPYNGQMESTAKIENQNAFMIGAAAGGTDIIVATSAFGMGVDKDDVGLVVHYDISDSLENYVQEAGRAGRREDLKADCYVLYNETDLDKHFALLAQTKLSISEIQQVWKAVKLLSGQRGAFTKSPLEIARAAGWDDSVLDVETRVKTAIAALENAGYIRRGNNVPHVYADGILVHNMQEAAEAIDKSVKFTDKQKEEAKRIVKFLISRRSHAKAGTEDAESRVDYIADRLGIPLQNVTDSVGLMKGEHILANSMDMSAHFQSTDSRKKIAAVLQKMAAVEDFLIDSLPRSGTILYKDLNDSAVRGGVPSSTVRDIRTVILYWLIRGYLKRRESGTDHITEELVIPRADLRKEYEKRTDLASFFARYLFEKGAMQENPRDVLFSVLELQEAYNRSDSLLAQQWSADFDDVKNALLYLSRIGALDLDGGFLVSYNAIQVERLSLSNKTKYKKEDYRKLDEFYAQRMQQIHIVGQYAKLMVKDYAEALTFVNDYFHMDYMLFKKKYFKGNQLQEIDRNITPEKYNFLFGSLSGAQRAIIDDDLSRCIVVAAGPGSGKTRVLVHKLASLLMLEDVKSDQLLMLTFSRSAATEFKLRLQELIGDAAYYVDIKTFHSFCFDLLGRVGTLDESSEVVSRAVRLIRDREVEPGKITKTVLVIDEAQDMSQEEYDLIRALMDYNENLRIIAVGDDDQNIFDFRGSSSEYLSMLAGEKDARQYELLDNYRSAGNIVRLANAYARTLDHRIKSGDILPVREDPGIVAITRYASRNLDIPTVELIKETYHGGSCCVLTVTNEDALRITGLLNRSGIHARLIQSSDGFNLMNLYELRTFTEDLQNLSNSSPFLPRRIWDTAVDRFTNAFSSSRNFEDCMALLNTFDLAYRKKYFSDFLEFLQESRYEDFIACGDRTVLVSTLHKSKGREFDSVYMMLPGFNTGNDSDRRPLYVGMTRARNTLYIGTNTRVMDFCIPEGVCVRCDNRAYQEPEEILMPLSFRDVNLGYFRNTQPAVKTLRSGDSLAIVEDGLVLPDSAYRTYVLKFSRQGMTTLAGLAVRGYVPVQAKVRFLVYWKDKDHPELEESLIVLPDLLLKKNSADNSGDAP